MSWVTNVIPRNIPSEMLQHRRLHTFRLVGAHRHTRPTNYLLQCPGAIRLRSMLVAQGKLAFSQCSSSRGFQGAHPFQVAFLLSQTSQKREAVKSFNITEKLLFYPLLVLSLVQPTYYL